MKREVSRVATEYAADWYTMHPKYRTKQRLAEQIQAAIDKAIQEGSCSAK